MEELSWMVEYAAFAAMLGLSMAIGLYFGCVEGKQNNVSEYLLGSKHMSVFPITMSLIARYNFAGPTPGDDDHIGSKRPSRHGRQTYSETARFVAAAATALNIFHSFPFFVYDV